MTKKGMGVLAALVTMLQAGSILGGEPVPLASEQGAALLASCLPSQDYLVLAQHFTTQSKQSYCGLASAEMVLNALSLSAPVREFAPYARFTQEGLLASDGSLGKLTAGLTLLDLARVLEGQGAQVTVHPASALDPGAFRRLLVRVLDRADGGYLIANYQRGQVGQGGATVTEAAIGAFSGHHSPLSAFHAGADRVLILDVARYRYPPVWVDATALYESMRGVDLDSGKSRGLLEVRAKTSIAGEPRPSRSPGQRRGFLLLGGALLLMFLAFFGGAFALGLQVGRRIQRRGAQ